MDIENKVSKKELAERKKEDATVTTTNDEFYKDKNIKSIKEQREKFRDAKNNEKEKVVESVLYRNGVVKNRLVAVYKNKRLVYTVAPKMKKGKK